VSLVVYSGMPERIADPHHRDARSAAEIAQ
jgi:hypothetical protein